MDLRFTAEEQAFRNEVRTFILTHLPEATREKMQAGKVPTKMEVVAWQKILNAKGWAVPNWPKEWGGTDWTPVQRYIFREELQLAPAPTPTLFNVNLLGPVLIAYGTQQQKARFLPRAANLDDWWCQGFSEPGAGSDLASLRTAAKREGDHYVVNGQKTWTTLAQYADWIFALVRTDPGAKKRQEGISFLLIDMKSPGIVVRPIITIDGAHEVNEVFFDNVRVPAENLVGAENQGWEVAKVLLSNERSGASNIGNSKERLAHLRRIAAETYDGDTPLIDDQNFRSRLAAIEIEMKAHEITTMRVLSAEQKRRATGPDPASSVIKLRNSEIGQKITELYLDVAGPYGLPFQPPDQVEGRNEPDTGFDWAGVIAPTYFNRRKLTIFGGTSEVQRNILAKGVLGL